MSEDFFEKLSISEIMNLFVTIRKHYIYSGASIIRKPVIRNVGYPKGLMVGYGRFKVRVRSQGRRSSARVQKTATLQTQCRVVLSVSTSSDVNQTQACCS